ncbi:MAG: hypothetical protein HY347_10910 [candidate division NC10 bacterium]|nr:hypothetical protein [candidate division NC10 bacterium]
MGSWKPVLAAAVIPLFAATPPGKASAEHLGEPKPKALYTVHQLECSEEGSGVAATFVMRGWDRNTIRTFHLKGDSPAFLIVNLETREAWGDTDGDEHMDVKGKIGEDPFGKRPCDFIKSLQENKR